MKMRLFFILIMISLFFGCGSTTKGIKAYKNGDYNTALKELTDSITNGSADFVDEFWFLGLTYEALGDLDKAKSYKNKAYIMCQKSEIDAKEFWKKYPYDYDDILDYGKTSGYDRYNRSNYQLKDLLWYEVYGQRMGFNKTDMVLVKIPMKIHYYRSGAFEVYDNSNHYTWINLWASNISVKDQLKEMYANNRAFIAYCEIKNGSIYANFVDFE